MADKDIRYEPNYVSCPGHTFLETIEAMGIPQRILALLLNQPVQTIQAIIQGKAAITTEIAERLEQILYIPASFWLNSERHYQEFLVRQADEQRLRKWVGWLKELPVQEMIRRGWIPPHTHEPLQVLELLRFFDVDSPKTWLAVWECTDIAYRKSSTSTNDPGALSAWLRQGEIEARIIDCPSFNDVTFDQALARIRTLTMEPVEHWQEVLVEQCASAGVALVFVPELPKMSISGATRWLTCRKPIIQLSLHYETDDQFWLTFFHEAGHVMQQKRGLVFLETDRKNEEEEERDADIFAANTLINPTKWRRFIEQKSYHTKEGIKKFAWQANIPSSIVVGRLQHEKLIPLDHYNDLKIHLNWQTEEATRA